METNNDIVVNKSQEVNIGNASIQRELTPEERRIVDELKKIDLSNRSAVALFGASEQAQIGVLSNRMLNKTRTNELKETGVIIADLMKRLEDYNYTYDDKGGFFRWFKKKFPATVTLRANYTSLAGNIEKIMQQLQVKEKEMEKLLTELDAYMQQNQENCKNLSLAIIAGEEIQRDKQVNLEQEMIKAEATNDLAKMHELSVIKDDYLRWDRRLYDLRTSLAITATQWAQIRNLQKSAESISEAIKSTVVTTIPIWKSQMVVALGMQSVDEAFSANELVRQATNKMLVINSERNKKLTIAAAKQMEKGAIDVATISKITGDIIETVKTCNQIVQEGIKTRQDASLKIESDLKKMIEVCTSKDVA